MIRLARAFLDGDEAAAIRARLAASGWQRYDLADRGRYELNERHREPALFAGLVGFAREAIGAPLAVSAVRWTRTHRGDYALFLDDTRRWRGRDRHVEACLDCSAAASNEGQIVYTGAANATLPNEPGLAAVIDRRAGFQRYERYLGTRFGEGEIVRLALVLEVGPGIIAE
jgi:hypothetical protein